LATDEEATVLGTAVHRIIICGPLGRREGLQGKVANNAPHSVNMPVRVPRCNLLSSERIIMKFGVGSYIKFCRNIQI